MPLSLPPALRVMFPTAVNEYDFFLKVFNKHTDLLGKILNRAVERSNGFILEIPDIDPKKAGAQSAQIDLRPNKSDSGAIVAMKFALFGAMVGPTILTDEANRFAMGLPTGPKSKLKAAKANFIPLPAKPSQYKPKALDADGDEIDDGISTINAETVRALTMPEEGEPITIIATIASIAVPIIVVLIPIVLPMLVEAGKGAFTVVSGAVQGASGGGQSGAQSFTDRNADGIDDVTGLAIGGGASNTNLYLAIGGVVAVLAVGAFVLWSD